MTTPLATIILNSYNQAAYVADAIESAQAQTISNIEILIVDNGSSDESPAIIRRYAARDARIRTWIHGDNVAVTRRFNAAIDAATSPFVSFLYSDDLLLPDKLERQLALFASLPMDYGVVYAPATGWNTKTGLRWTYGSVGASGWVFRDLMRRHFAGQIDMVSPLTRTECFRRHRFYEDVFAEGEGIFLRLALTHRFWFDPEPGCVLRDHGGNAGKAVRRNAEMTMALLERLTVHPDLPRSAVDEVRRFRGALLRSYAWQAARLGEDPAWARRCLREAAKIDPLRLGSARAVGALLLSAIPDAPRRWLNALASRVLGKPGNDTLTEFRGAP